MACACVRGSRALDVLNSIITSALLPLAHTRTHTHTMVYRYNAQIERIFTNLTGAHDLFFSQTHINAQACPPPFIHAIVLAVRAYVCLHIPFRAPCVGGVCGVAAERLPCGSSTLSCTSTKALRLYSGSHAQRYARTPPESAVRSAVRAAAVRSAVPTAHATCTFRTQSNELFARRAQRRKLNKHTYDDWDCALGARACV